MRAAAAECGNCFESPMCKGYISTVKGGEKGMASEWEEREKLSKDELIIELMRERWAHRNINQRLRMIIDYDYPDSNEIPCVVEEDDYSSPGYETTDTWAKKIVLHAKSRCTGEFGPEDAFDYGLNWDQAEQAFEELVTEGKLDWPSSDPRSGRFSGIAGLYADEVAAMDPEEREKRMRAERGGSDGQA